MATQRHESEVLACLLKRYPDKTGKEILELMTHAIANPGERILGSEYYYENKWIGPPVNQYFDSFWSD